MLSEHSKGSPLITVAIDQGEHPLLHVVVDGSMWCGRRDLHSQYVEQHRLDCVARQGCASYRSPCRQRYAASHDGIGSEDNDSEIPAARTQQQDIESETSTARPRQTINCDKVNFVQEDTRDHDLPSGHVAEAAS
jgi:hypothetical protein